MKLLKKINKEEKEPVINVKGLQEYGKMVFFYLVRINIQRLIDLMILIMQLLVEVIKKECF